MTELPLNQIAISVSDLQQSHRWYRDIFGYQEAGGTYMFVPLLGSAEVQGVPGATSKCWWLMDQQDFFQLELFEFSKPPPQSLPSDWRPCDIGYTTIGIHVADFDGTMNRLAQRCVHPLSPPLGDRGSRRVCVRDPDGVLLEIMEDDPRSGERRARPYDVPVVTRFVTLSVPDLDEARHTWIDVLGLPEVTDVTLHGPEHEALWGLEGATRESFLLRAGDMFIEVVRYLDPVGKPWPPGYQITDHGLLNVALGLRSFAQVQQLVGECESVGIHANAPPPATLKHIWACSYVNDPMGFSIELLYHAKPGKRQWPNPFGLFELGFRPTQAPIRRAEATTAIAANPELVWGVLTDHASMSDWAPFKRSEVSRATSDPSGVGTVRQLSGGPAGLRVEETIVVAEKPYRLEYTAEGATGTSFYHGFVSLDPTAGGGTRVRWEAQFRSPLPGADRITGLMLKRLVKGLREKAEEPPVTKQTIERS